MRYLEYHFLICGMKPPYVVIRWTKKFFVVYLSQLVVDPTGCGDSFAGTIAAYLASGSGDVSRDELREALVRATVTASFTLESFGTSGLLSLDNDVFTERLSQFRAIVG